MTPLASMRPALLALSAIAADFAHLPAATIQVSPGHPDRLEIALHDGIGPFEVWRAALGIDPGAVGMAELMTGIRLAADTRLHGADIHLTGHGPHLAAGQRGAAA